jgi:peptidoglycan/xylan/chitin deacetylase (PgdA/CDA1 family)
MGIYRGMGDLMSEMKWYPIAGLILVILMVAALTHPLPRMKWYQTTSLILVILLLAPLAPVIPLKRYGREDHQTLVALTFDDGYSSWVSNVNPILQKYGLPATGFVNNPDCLATKESASADPMFSWNDIRKLREAGWEIGWHTASHPHLNHLGRAEVIDELTAWKGVFESYGLPKPLSFAYPYGCYNETAVEMASELFLGARTWDLGVNTPRSLRENPAKVKMAWKPAKQTTKVYSKSGVFLVFVYHTVGQIAEWQPEPDITVERFEELCRFLAHKRDQGEIDVVSFEEGVRRMKKRDPSSAWILRFTGFEFQRVRHGIPIPSRYRLVFYALAGKFSAISVLRGRLGYCLALGVLVGAITFILAAAALSLATIP